MKKIERIMVALGSARYSKGIFNYAALLAGALNSELIAVNIIHTRDVEAVRSISSLGYNVDGEHYIESIRKEREKFLTAIIEKSGFPEDRVNLIIEVGNPIDKLLEFIVEKNADMIVMGPKGRTDLEHVLIGSVAQKLFRRSPVPVVSYRGETYAKHLKKRVHIHK